MYNGPIKSFLSNSKKAKRKQDLLYEEFRLMLRVCNMFHTPINQIFELKIPTYLGMRRECLRELENEERERRKNKR